MITKESIDHLKNVVDIVDVIGRYIEVKKAGSSYKALCPFHSEKTPSFHISPAKQLCHCYSCGGGGDVIRFVQELEKISFSEAVEKIASMYNIPLEYSRTQIQKPKVLEAINQFYIQNYDTSPQAKAYVHSRGIFSSTAERFGIGYTPAPYATTNFLSQHGFSTQEAIEAGVLGSDTDRVFVRLTDRITFPIFNSSGLAVIGFGGRTMGNHPAKYINSPQTPFFNKSQVLYAYHLAKETIHTKKQIVVTEGYLDVIMLHQAGFTNAVATLGTALTKEHFPLLRRGEPAVVLAYDGDNAGRSAAYKGAKLLISGGFRGGVVLFEGGRDPADMVNEGKEDEILQMLAHPIDFIPFVLSTMVGGYDLSRPESKEQALMEVQQFISSLSPILQEEYKHHAAQLLGLHPKLIKTAIARAPKRGEIRQAPLDDIDKAEAMLLKTAILQPLLIDRFLELGDEEIFLKHRDLFMCLVREGGESDRLRGIVFDDTVKPLAHDDDIKRAILDQKKQWLMRRWDAIKYDPTLDMATKAFRIRQCHHLLERLKKGEMFLLSSTLDKVGHTL